VFIRWGEARIPSAAKAGIQDKPFIAAVNRCATQKQKTKSSFSANCKADIEARFAIAAVNRCATQKAEDKIEFFSKL
jgi:hypothetical protein